MELPAKIHGIKISLRPAMMTDRRLVFSWLTDSDLTSDMIGPPLFPESPVPDWDTFITDYKEHFFDGSQPLKGRCFIIELDGQSIGQINYDQIRKADHSTELDIWMSDSRFTGKGYGSEAIDLLCRHLHVNMVCHTFFIGPSARNKRAVSAYQKAGFKITEEIPPWFKGDYTDSLVMIRKMD